MIFISYSWDDSFVASRIENILLYCGVKYWIDKNDLDLTSCIKKQIISALNTSDIILYLSSQASIKSAWVFSEISMAHAMGKTILKLEVKENNVHNNGIHLTPSTTDLLSTFKQPQSSLLL